MLVWVRLKNLARKMGITIYQVKKRLLDDYMVEQMRNPSVMFGMK
jgi:macrodomain Ter protein organizer (MatP/YcbG family)